jgi:hypothetical protein
MIGVLNNSISLLCVVVVVVVVVIINMLSIAHYVSQIDGPLLMVGFRRRRMIDDPTERGQQKQNDLNNGTHTTI